MGKGDFRRPGDEASIARNWDRIFGGDEEGYESVQTAEGRNGHWMQTYGGAPFWPLDPRPEEVNIVDIAHALSNICRYGGHCDTFYSVAQHSYYVARWLHQQGYPTWKVLAGLLHDAPEAYIGDMPRPLKYSSGFGEGFRAVDAQLEKVIAEAFGLPTLMDEDIKEADNVVLVTELRDIMGGLNEKHATANYPHIPLPQPILPLLPRVAEQQFLELFDYMNSRLSFEKRSAHAG